MPSASRRQSSTTTSTMACGGGKNGNGSNPSFAVLASQAAKKIASTNSHGKSRWRRWKAAKRTLAKAPKASATANAPQAAAKLPVDAQSLSGLSGQNAVSTATKDQAAAADSPPINGRLVELVKKPKPDFSDGLGTSSATELTANFLNRFSLERQDKSGRRTSP